MPSSLGIKKVWNSIYLQTLRRMQLLLKVISSQAAIPTVSICHGIWEDLIPVPKQNRSELYR